MKYKWLLAVLTVAVLSEFSWIYVKSHRATFGACGLNGNDRPGLRISRRRSHDEDPLRR
jgi:hypothetical protein